MKQIETAIAKLNKVIWYECGSGKPDEELINDLQEIQDMLDEIKKSETT